MVQSFWLEIRKICTRLEDSVSARTTTINFGGEGRLAMRMDKEGVFDNLIFISNKMLFQKYRLNSNVN